jgi:hypothetical protein
MSSSVEELKEDAIANAMEIIQYAIDEPNKVNTEKEWVTEINDWRQANNAYYPWFQDIVYYEFLLQNPEYFYQSYRKYSYLLDEIIKNLDKIVKLYHDETTEDYHINKYYLNKFEQLQQDILYQKSLGIGQLNLPKDMMNEIVSHLTIPDLKNLGLTTSGLTSVAKASIDQKLLKILRNHKINSVDDIPNLILKLMNDYYGKQFEIRSIYDYDDGDLFLDIDIFDENDENRSYTIYLYLNSDKYKNVYEYYKYAGGPEWLFRFLFDNGLWKRFKVLAKEDIENQSD